MNRLYPRKLIEEEILGMCATLQSGIYYIPVKNIKAKAYGNINLPVVLYGCANFLSRKEDKLKVFFFFVSC